jgi:hypothetical protein
MIAGRECDCKIARASCQQQEVVLEAVVDRDGSDGVKLCLR